jgi:alanine dehydrogenase
LADACRKFGGLAQGVNVLDGQLTCQAVADAHGLPYIAYVAK